jgi:Xaa-Pro aminopeptidase
MPEDFACPSCKIGRLGLTTQLPESIKRIGEKKTHHLSEFEARIVDDLKENATLLHKYGKVAAYVLAGRLIKATEAKAVLRRTHKISDRLFQAIMDSERKVLRRRFW